MALYRKYRPATFAEVVGQEHVTEPLSTALDTGRISHAYLFSGPRGCGKTSSARILARSLNCVEGPTSTPCGVCSSCVALGPGGPGNLDVIELDAASHGGVDDTRELRDRAFYAPAESRYRVFIVDEAHMVTTAGFNALLKIVEEPPAHLIFVFATTEPDKVLPTIRSRTHHYPFRLLPPATMRGLLGKICDQEGVQVDEAVYPLVIRAGGGSPRDSLSVLDQLLAGAGTEGVTYPRVVSLLGVTDIALIDDAIAALADDDGATLFGVIDRVVESGHDPRRFATDLLERLRDLILMRAVPDATERGLVAGPGDVIDRMRDQAHRIGPATLTRYAELLHEGLGEMRGATAPRLLLEVIAARMLLPSASDAESAALQRIERIERRIAGGAMPPSAPAGGQAPAGGRATPDAAPAAPETRTASAAPQSEAGGAPRRRGAEALAALRAEKAPTPAPETNQAPAQPTPPTLSSAGRSAATPPPPVDAPPSGAQRASAPDQPPQPASGPAATTATEGVTPSVEAATTATGGATTSTGGAATVTGGAASAGAAAAATGTAFRPAELNPASVNPATTQTAPAFAKTTAEPSNSTAAQRQSAATRSAGSASDSGSVASTANSGGARPASAASACGTATVSEGDFDKARETLLMLVGYASARAVTEPAWIEKLTAWAGRLQTLTPDNAEAIRAVMAEDAPTLRELSGSAPAAQGASIVAPVAEHGAPQVDSTTEARSVASRGGGAAAQPAQSSTPDSAASDSVAQRASSTAASPVAAGDGAPTTAPRGDQTAAIALVAQPDSAAGTPSAAAEVATGGIPAAGASAPGAARGGSERASTAAAGVPAVEGEAGAPAQQHSPSTTEAATEPSAGNLGGPDATAIGDNPVAANAAQRSTAAASPAQTTGGADVTALEAVSTATDASGGAAEADPALLAVDADAVIAAGRVVAEPSNAATVAAARAVDADTGAKAADRDAARAAAVELSEAPDVDADRTPVDAEAGSVAVPDPSGQGAESMSAPLAEVSTVTDPADADLDSASVEPEAAAPLPGGDAVLQEVEAAWADIKAKLREFGPALPALLTAASVARVEGNTIVLAHQHAALAQRLSEPKNVEAVRSTVRAVLGREHEVRWEVGGAPQAGGGGRGGAAGPAGGEGGAAKKKAAPKFSRPSQAKSAAAVSPDVQGGGDSGGWGTPAATGSASADSRGGENSGSGASAPPEDDIPLPDGPDLPDDPGGSDYSSVGYDGVPPASTEEEEREMLAAAAQPVAPGDRRDPDEVALELLRSELGATPVEG
uniref:DNA polymerase III subunit gamma and tau n=1 Tax=Nocardia uniformis TaxID=53432 RepID=UPI0027D87BC4|nr:DNA polymerase III subunit gamma and tau [Nocardia uniformis]